MQRIFLSHTYVDKPIVEQIALQLEQIFGRDEIFYDAWSIQPGDGIIEKMNEGLEAPEFVFFFVSATSLMSKMVNLEWQNALFRSSKGKTRIIPVRMDSSSMPPILSQNLYIDLYTNGLDVAINQIVNVCQGNSSFTPQHVGFSNITFSYKKSGENDVVITISASHYLEPNTSFIILADNNEDDIDCGINGSGVQNSGFHQDIKLDNGLTGNGFFIQPIGTTLSPGFPIELRVTPKPNKVLCFKGLLHEKSKNFWATVPLVSKN